MSSLVKYFVGIFLNNPVIFYYILRLVLFYSMFSPNGFDIDQLNLTDIKLNHVDIRQNIRYKWLRQLELLGYLFLSMIIHVTMLFAGKTLLIAEWIKHKLVGKPVKK